MPNENPLCAMLIALGLSSEDSFEVFLPHVRDRADLAVLRCKRCGVLVLSRIDSVTGRYEQQAGFQYWGASSREEGLRGCLDDDRRRGTRLRPLIANKRWLDFGAGVGGVLDRLKAQAAEIHAVEPQSGPREQLVKAGYHAVANISELHVLPLDVITLFHVLGHLTQPLDTLRELHAHLAPGGQIVIEVPHARDFLIEFLQVEAYKSFTRWGTTNIPFMLHTRESLQCMLAAAGFKNIVIEGVQRYPLSNHLHWLARGKPGGHLFWSGLNAPDLEAAYTNMLNRLNYTDTLLAFAERPV